MITNESTLLQEHEGIACHLARRYASSLHDPEDVKQAARVGMLKGMRGFDPDRRVKLSTRLYACAESEVRHLLRRDTGVIHVPYEAQKDVIPARVSLEAAIAVEAQVPLTNSAVVLREALATLPRQWQDMVLLHYVHGYEATRIAAVYRLSKDNVYRRLKLAVTQLHAYMANQNIDFSELLKV